MQFVRYLAALVALALVSCGAQPAFAQVAAPTFQSGSATFKAQGTFQVDSTGAEVSDPATHAAKVEFVSPQSVTLNGTPSVSDATSVFWNDATGTPSALGGSATFTGTARDVGVAVGTKNGAAYFNASFLADQAGTAYVDASNDGTNWYNLASNAITAGSAVILTVPVMTRYHRARLVNGSTAETYLWINTAYSKG